MDFERIELTPKTASESGEQSAIETTLESEKQPLIPYEELEKSFNQGDFGRILSVANETNNFEKYSDTNSVKEKTNLNIFKKTAIALLKLRIDTARRMYRTDMQANPSASEEEKSALLQRHLNAYTLIHAQLSGANMSDPDIEPLAALLNKPIDED